MILAIDMGNTNVKLGIVQDENTIIEERIHTDDNQTSLEYAEHILHVLSLYNISEDEIEGAILSSVVPSLTPVLSAAVNKIFGFRPILVNSETKTSVHVREGYQKGIGADLLVTAEAVAADYPLPCVVVNMGTATTITIVDDTREFLGGVILPGMRTSLQALSTEAATLPDISLDKAGSTISLDTEECMRSGIVYGCAGQIDGIVSRMEEELGKDCNVVITGGMAKFCVPYCVHEVTEDETLMMKGLYKLYQLNV